jgi:hypothetical protein
MELIAMNSLPHEPPPQWQIERQKWLHEQNLRAAERAHDKADELFHRLDDATVNSANVALRMALLINGGGAIALLSFIGNLPADEKRAIAGALVWFAAGAAAAVVGMGLAYFTNLASAANVRSWKWQDRAPYLVDGPDTSFWKWWKAVLHISAGVVGVASLLLFVVGVLCVWAAFTRLA